MKKAELAARIAYLEEQVERQKSEIINGIHHIKMAFTPKNIAKRAAVSVMSKIRAIFQSKKRHAFIEE